MALWSTVADLLESSGWTTVLTEAEVASSGVAESFRKASHLTRTRHAHQVTLLTLSNVKQDAYSHSAGDVYEPPSMTTWESEMCKRSPTFLFWEMIMSYETLILMFIRSHREKRFFLFVEVLEKLVHRFFVLDHVHYARWLPIHLRDMKSLPNPIWKEFGSSPKQATHSPHLPLIRPMSRRTRMSKQQAEPLASQRIPLLLDGGCSQVQKQQDFCLNLIKNT